MMAKDLQIFDFNKHVVRVIVRNNDELWFVVNDVCAALEIDNPRNVITRLLKDDVCQADITDSLDRKQKANMVNEAGLYELIFRSDKPEALKFRHWVTHKVLPSIRKTGKFSVSKIEVPIVIEKLEEMLRDAEKKANKGLLPWDMVREIQSTLLDQIRFWSKEAVQWSRLYSQIAQNYVKNSADEKLKALPSEDSEVNKEEGR